MTNHNKYQLKKNILALSESDIWPIARTEWELSEVYFEDEPSTCLCSHFPIIEVCVLRNKSNGNLAEVGNVCVNGFIGIPSKIIFDGIKRVSKDTTKALNLSAADYAQRKGWVNDWEHEFLVDTARKRILSPRQMSKRDQINRTVLSRMKRSG
jgi:hypothetical protein